MTHNVTIMCHIFIYSIMLILSEVSRPYPLSTINTPLGVSHFWTFSGHMMDFKLEPIEYIEETTGPTIQLQIENTVLDIPTSWSIIAVDTETYRIDCIPVTACATFEHDLLLFSPDDSKLVTAKVTVNSFQKSAACVHPMLPKGSAMAYPVTTKLWHQKPLCYSVILGPFDLHRYVGNKTVGDILG